ncbi:MAG: DUF1961 family protein [Firmicutes bacterium]|nr:DUF1961 family protein [Bacillota bacterium]
MRKIYENPLSCPEDIRGFVLEGQARIGFEDGCMRMENGLAESEGQKANYVLWCPEDFPSDVRIEWEFKPLTDKGLCILFFAAMGREGGSIFDEGLAARTGEYRQYHHGDINAFHVSYFRRKEPDERAFHTCNLRKSYGFYLVTQGADPIPEAAECKDFYRLAVEKHGAEVSFSVNDLKVFTYVDDGVTYGERLGGGKIGFRQLAPLKALYRNLAVYALD